MGAQAFLSTKHLFRFDVIALYSLLYLLVKPPSLLSQPLIPNSPKKKKTLTKALAPILAR